MDREAAVTFGCPASRLVVYGTLRPGEGNHHLVVARGVWEPATLLGVLGSWAGYPMFTPTSSGEFDVDRRNDGDEVPADLLTSTDLPAHHARLDEFEGDAYRRDLVVVQTAAGAVVAHCYVDASVT